MVRTYKPAKVSGYSVEFVDRDQRIWARAPAISHQFIGSGKTKGAALEEARKTIKHLKKVGTA